MAGWEAQQSSIPGFTSQYWEENKGGPRGLNREKATQPEGGPSVRTALVGTFPQRLSSQVFCGGTRGPWPAPAAAGQRPVQGQRQAGTDVVGFLSLYRVPLSLPLVAAASGHHLVSWLLGSPLHRTYLLDGLILSSFSGLVMCWCLVCLSLSLIPLWPGF